MALTADTIESALRVRQGLKRLRDIPETDRPAVSQALRSLTDVQFATLAAAKEVRFPRAGRMVGTRVRAGRWQ